MIEISPVRQTSLGRQLLSRQDPIHRHYCSLVDWKHLDVVAKD